MIMMALYISGAKTFTIVSAIVAFSDWRLCRSPTILWEKNSIGSLRMVHMYVLEPAMSSSPLILYW